MNKEQLTIKKVITWLVLRPHLWLTAIFVIAKLVSAVDYSWLWVLSPLWVISICRITVGTLVDVISRLQVKFAR